MEHLYKSSTIIWNYLYCIGNIVPSILCKRIHFLNQVIRVHFIPQFNRQVYTYGEGRLTDVFTNWDYFSLDTRSTSTAVTCRPHGYVFVVLISRNRIEKRNWKLPDSGESSIILRTCTVACLATLQLNFGSLPYKKR